jgi:serine/threonine protein kinase
MAELFLARATGIEGFEKLVVLKRILPQHAGDGRFIRMFLQEARLAATLAHPNIVQVYDIGKVGGTYFFTMEHVHGVDVRRLLQLARNCGEAMPLAHALAITLGTAAGLHYAHEKLASDGLPLGIVHRDVSPSNVLVSYDGSTKLVDFGIAKANQTRSETQPGTTKGKIQYMSPEQCQGETLDRRSDVFSLGILLYELTTGTRPFEGDNEAVVLRSLLAGTVARPSERCPGYPPDLEAVVLRALKTQPAERFATAEELQLALEAFVREHRLVVSPVALARYVSELAGQELAAWRAAERSGISLVDFVARTAPEDPSLDIDLDVEPPRTASIEAPIASDATVPDARLRPVGSAPERRSVPFDGPSHGTFRGRMGGRLAIGGALFFAAVLGARVIARSGPNVATAPSAPPGAGGSITELAAPRANGASVAAPAPTRSVNSRSGRRAGGRAQATRRPDEWRRRTRDAARCTEAGQGQDVGSRLDVRAIAG